MRRIRWRSSSFESCRIPARRLIGAEGEGFKIAMRTLDVFRSSVRRGCHGVRAARFR